MKFLKICEEYVTAASILEAATLDTAWSAAQIRSAMEREDTLYVVAVESGILCAVSSCVFSKYEAMIENVAVAPGFRRKGAAKTLLSLIESEARKRKLENISLEVASRNQAAIQLYEKAGFKAVGVRKGFYRKQNDDALVMIKEINK